MDFGLCVPNFGQKSDVQSIVSAAQAAEAYGYLSVWVTDHLVVPIAHANPYGRTFEALTTLAFLAHVTRRVKLGTSILILPLRNPVEVARRIATIDCLSNGRTILGIGVGWLETEFKFLGANFHDRGARVNESIELMRKIWSGGRIDIKTKRFKISDGVGEPPPIQGANLPIWIGGSSDAAIRRAAKYGDAWHPVGVHPTLLPAMKEKLEKWAKGRDVKLTMRLFVDLFGRKMRGYKSSTGELRYAVGGSIGDVIDGIQPLYEQGIEELVVYFGDIDKEEYTKKAQIFSEKVAPQFR